MKSRSIMAMPLALAILMAQAFGLHFHESAPHDIQIATHAHAGDHSHAQHALSGLSDHHLLHHLAGAEDVEAGAIPPLDARLVLLLLALGMLGWLIIMAPFAPSARPCSQPHPPLRPPRPQHPAEIRPPSQGPPPAA